LVADAGHNLSDVLALLLAWGAVLLSRRRPTPGRTYGMRRSSILVALVNAVVLLVAVGAIAWEAVRRFSEPAPVAEQTVIWVAMIGIIINTGTALLFLSVRKGDVNMRGAFLHMAADAGVSLGVVLAGGAILVTGWGWLDPVVSLAIVVVILIGTWDLLRDSVNLALDAVPESVDLQGVRQYLAGLPKVVDVHDLHIWGMSTTETALTAHLVMTAAICDDAFFARIENELHTLFGIEHTTIQVETGNPAYPCRCRLTPT
jgi:cobalt-zinc-cadmium efflux system protein